MNLSVFPNGIDTFVEHYDLQPSDLPHIRRYQELKQKSYLSVEEQNELSNLTHQLREKIFLADDFNKLQDCITNLEVFFRDETQGHLDGLKEELKQLTDKTLGDIVQAGEDYINTSKHLYTSWVTTANQSDFNILEGSEAIAEDVELNFQEEILDLFLNGDMLLPERDYTFQLATNTKKQVIRLSNDLASTLVAGQRVVAKWFMNVGKLYIDHSHEHKTGGKDALVVDMEMLSEDVRIAIGDTTQTDEIVKELEKVRVDLDKKTNIGHKHTKEDITNFPTSLPANGGNADTVGGKSASQFASSSHDHANIYAPTNHAHGNYSTTDHTHTQYATSGHTHNYAPNNGVASTGEAQTGSDDSKYMTPLKVKQAISALGMTGVDWGRIYCGGSSLSGSANVDTGIMSLRKVEGSIAVQSGNEMKFTKTGMYLLLLETDSLELKSGGASGVNVNYHLGGRSTGYVGLYPDVKRLYNFCTVGTVDVTSTATGYGISVSASPIASGQSFSISFGSIEYYVIKIA